MKHYCISCGKEIGHKKKEKMYSDGGILSFSHGFLQCRDCYIKAGHKFCPDCDACMMDDWKHCPKCGYKWIKEKK